MTLGGWHLQKRGTCEGSRNLDALTRKVTRGWAVLIVNWSVTFTLRNGRWSQQSKRKGWVERKRLTRRTRANVAVSVRNRRPPSLKPFNLLVCTGEPEVGPFRLDTRIGGFSLCPAKNGKLKVKEKKIL